MADDTPEERPEQAAEAADSPGTPAPDAPAEPAASESPAEQPQADQPAADAPAEEPADTPAEEPDAAEPPAGEPAAPDTPAVSEPAPVAAEATPEPAAEEPAPAAEDPTEPAAADAAAADDDEQPAPRVKPAIPGADLEVDIVLEGSDPLSRAAGEDVDPYAVDDDESPAAAEEGGDALAQPIASAAIDLAAGARYKATGKRKTAIARVVLRPGSGTYTINGRPLDQHFPRSTLQRNIRQPLETVGYESRMDVIARMHGGGISAQAGALRHGISRALLEADPNLRGELKRRGFLTRDSRAKERKKAGLKKARKRPQFSKR
jgi:small subunit ribosomal protein S9